MALTYHNNNSISNVTSFPQIPTGSLTLLSTATASSSSSISFTSGIDSTYDVYQFEFNNIHASNVSHLQFQCSTNGGSSYGIPMTTTYFRAVHDEADTTASLTYDTGSDLAQSTSFQLLTENSSNNDGESVSGIFYFFSPSSTTYVKHFISITQHNRDTPQYSDNFYVAGYLNTTSAINAIKFQMNTGTMDDGKIKMYGIKA
jgi:hypothetical protein